ncbi:MAG: arsenate reductase (glutaredoxin) [Flavobacteriales bacterium]|nr:arsenate reductase (glutaredoxin) [Flavobacteriales bacterium]
MKKSKFIIYHNPRCSKSRCALDILRENGIEAQVVEYMKEIPTREEFKLLLARLHLGPKDILRTGEELFKSKLKGLRLTDEEWITIMLENPQLIERPIVVKGNKGIVARPPEKVLELI